MASLLLGKRRLGQHQFCRNRGSRCRQRASSCLGQRRYPNIVPRPAASQQRCSSVRVVSTNTAAQFSDNVVPRWSLTPSTPQGVWKTLNNGAPWGCWSTLSLVQPLLVIAVVLQMPHACSIPAHIAGRQEWPHIAAAVQLSRLVGFGGGGSEAKERWLLQPPSVVPGQRVCQEGIGDKQLPDICAWHAC